MSSLYWYGFRQVKPHPQGKAVACGPFPTREAAMVDRERAKSDPDCVVSTPFIANTKIEAEIKAERLT